MNAVITKLIDVITKQQHKIIESLIVLFIFTSIFTKETLKIFNIFSNKLHAILPKSFFVFITKLRFSHNDILTLWTFIFVVFGITIFLNFIIQLLHDRSYCYIDKGGELLFDINTIFLILVLIHNTLFTPRIIITSISVSGIYSLFIIISIAFYTLFSILTYLSPFRLIYIKIHESEYSSIKKGILYILYTIFLIWLSQVVLKLLIPNN